MREAMHETPWTTRVVLLAVFSLIGLSYETGKHIVEGDRWGAVVLVLTGAPLPLAMLTLVVMVWVWEA